MNPETKPDRKLIGLLYPRPLVILKMTFLCTALVNFFTTLIGFVFQLLLFKDGSFKSYEEKYVYLLFWCPCLLSPSSAFLGATSERYSDLQSYTKKTVVGIQMEISILSYILIVKQFQGKI